VDPAVKLGERGLPVGVGLRNLAQRLRGIVSGAEVLRPGPGHGPKDRSLSVRPSDSPDGFITYSFANDDWRACLDRAATDELVHQNIALCPMRKARSVAWFSTAGFHQRSKCTTCEAAVRVSPEPPG
jgi:hypothetical protein